MQVQFGWDAGTEGIWEYLLVLGYCPHCGICVNDTNVTILYTHGWGANIEKSAFNDLKTPFLVTVSFPNYTA